jgi:hypothetical protein
MPFFRQTLKGLRRPSRFSDLRHNPFRVASFYLELVIPGLPKCNPGLKLANAFSVIRSSIIMVIAANGFVWRELLKPGFIIRGCQRFAPPG